MVLGIVVGYACHETFPDKRITAEIASHIGIATDVFLRLIKMIIALLVFSTLGVGAAHMGDGKTAGRIGAGLYAGSWWPRWSRSRSAWCCPTCSSWAATWSCHCPERRRGDQPEDRRLHPEGLSTHLVPKSPIEAMANNEILQVLVFSIFFGAALAGLGEHGRALTYVVDQLAQVMLRITGTIMSLAPLAVFAAVASVVTTQGLERCLATFAKWAASIWACSACGRC